MTCDLCGVDQGTNENLISVIDLKFPTVSRVYDCCDLLVCYECLEKYSDELEIVEDC